MGCDCIYNGEKIPPLLFISLYSFVIFILSFAEIMSFSNYGYIEIPNDMYQDQKKLAKNKTITNLISNFCIFFYSLSRLFINKCRSGFFLSLIILIGGWLASLILTSQAVGGVSVDLIENYKWIFKMDAAILAFNCANFFPIFIYFCRSCKDDQDSSFCDNKYLGLFVLFADIFECLCELRCDCNCCEDCEKFLELKVFNKLKIQRDEKSKINQDLANELNKLGEEVEKLKKENQDCKNEKEKLIKNNKEIEAKQKNLINEKSRLDNQINELNLLINDLNNAKQNFNREKEELEKQKEDLDRRKSNLQNKQKDLLFQSIMIRTSKSNDIVIYTQNPEFQPINIIFKFKSSIPELSNLEDKKIQCREDELFCDVLGRIYSEQPYSNFVKYHNDDIKFKGKSIKLFKSIKDNLITDGETITIESSE